MLESGVSYNGNSAFFSTYPAYIITNSKNNISALTEYTYSISIYRTETNITDTNRFFRGYMKDAKVFNHALTAEEISIEYNTMFNNEVQIHESGVLYAKDLKQ